MAGKWGRQSTLQTWSTLSCPKLDNHAVTHTLVKVYQTHALQVAIYGLPSAGVLALELLQQSQARGHASKQFPRSEVIQNLSVFVACLGSMHTEGDGNYQLCLQARRMLQRILDTVLSPQEPAAPPNPQTILTPSSTEFGGDGIYDFSWMDNAEFDADFWMNLPDHPLLAVSENVSQALPAFMSAV